MLFSKVDENSQNIRTSSNSKISTSRQNSRSKSTDRTTKLLAVILILFLVAEFPQVIIKDFLTSASGVSGAGNTRHAVSNLWPAILP